MSAASAPTRTLYLSQFERREQTRSEHVPSWLRALRRQAIGRFAELGFPSTKEEDWRFTNVAPIAAVPFEDGLPADVDDASAGIERSHLFLRELRSSQLVFVNGRYCPELSAHDPGALGVQVEPLATAVQAEPELLETFLARFVRDGNGFAALNAAFLEDGALVRVRKGANLEAPIYLTYVAAPDGRPRVSHPRNLVVVEEDSQVTIVETHVGASDGVYFTNAVTEIVVGPGARVQYEMLQQIGDQAFHVGHVHVQQERGSSFSSSAIFLGGGLVRNDLHVVLAAEGSECNLDGLYLATGKQHVDNHTTIDHATPHCSSRELYKGVLDDQAKAVFNGKIIVRKDAQKTDARQTNKNLVLSEGASINTKPQLEIFADDVKCAHGATIGQLDADALYYLQSRGIDAEEARQLLIHAFASDVVERVRARALRTQLENLLAAWLGAIRHRKEAA